MRRTWTPKAECGARSIVTINQKDPGEVRSLGSHRGDVSNTGGDGDRTAGRSAWGKEERPPARIDPETIVAGL
jgi:hypothetical protein